MGWGFLSFWRNTVPSASRAKRSFKRWRALKQQQSITCQKTNGAMKMQNTYITIHIFIFYPFHPHLKIFSLITYVLLRQFSMTHSPILLSFTSRFPGFISFALSHTTVHCVRYNAPIAVVFEITIIWVQCYEMQAAASYIMLLRFYHTTRHHIQEDRAHLGICYVVLYHIFPTCNRGHFINKIIQSPEVWCPVGVAESSFKWE